MNLKGMYKLYASFQLQVYYVEIDFANKFTYVIFCLRIWKTTNHHPFGETSWMVAIAKSKAEVGSLS